ncbi:hypothetical protein Tco_0087731 [Tanacetum coccineum]
MRIRRRDRRFWNNLTWLFVGFGGPAEMSNRGSGGSGNTNSGAMDFACLGFVHMIGVEIQIISSENVRNNQNIKIKRRLLEESWSWIASEMKRRTKDEKFGLIAKASNEELPKQNTLVMTNHH